MAVERTLVADVNCHVLGHVVLVLLWDDHSRAYYGCRVYWNIECLARNDVLRYLNVLSSWAAFVDGCFVKLYYLIDHLARLGLLGCIGLKNPVLGNLVQLERVIAECASELFGERIAILHDELLHGEHVDVDICVSGIVYSVP